MADMTHKERYIETVGRRKTAVARVRLSKDTRASVIVNGKELSEYFATPELQKIAQSPQAFIPEGEKFKVTALLKGGGIHAQAEALRHGISRALVAYKEELRRELKKARYLKRDPRAKERRKFGLKKARRAPQWSKR